MNSFVRVFYPECSLRGHNPKHITIAVGEVSNLADAGCQGKLQSTIVGGTSVLKECYYQIFLW